MSHLCSSHGGHVTEGGGIAEDGCSRGQTGGIGGLSAGGQVGKVELGLIVGGGGDGDLETATACVGGFVLAGGGTVWWRAVFGDRGEG